MKECVHSLTQLGPGDSMEDCHTKFGVQIAFEYVTSIKTGFCEILLPPPGEAYIKNKFSSITQTEIIFTVTKMHLERIDLNPKK